MQPKERYLKARAEFDEKVADPKVCVTERDDDLLTEFIIALHPELKPTSPDALRVPAGWKKQSRKYNTLAGYVTYIGAYIERTGLHLDSMTAEEINETTNAMLEDSHTGWDAPSQNTIKNYVNPLKVFYRFHRDNDTHLGDVYGDIASVATPKTRVEPRDMWDAEEIAAMRNAIDESRDRALFEFLLNTGQRIQAALTLRVKDVDVDAKRFYLNPEQGGLKNADQNGLERPLLGSRAYMQNWLAEHPNPEPESFVFCPLKSYTRREKFKNHHLLDTSVRRIFKRVGERAGVDKPVNPHAFRHNFVCIAHEQGMDPDTIRWMLGHGEGSRVMETTYKHLKNGEYIKNAEVAVGFRKREKNEKLTPAYCPICGLAPDPGARFCDNCGEAFGMNRMKEAKAEDAVHESKGAAQTPEEHEQVDLLRELLRSDEQAKAAALDELEDELYERLERRMERDSSVRRDRFDDEGAAGAIADDD